MLNRVSIISPLAYTGKQTSVDVKDQLAINQIPIAKKINDKKQRAVSSLAVLAVGSAMAPLAGRYLDVLSGSGGKLIQMSYKLSDKTQTFDKALAKLDLSSKLKKILDPIKNKLFKVKNIDTFKEGFYSSGGLRGAANAAKDSALKVGDKAKQAVAQRTLDSLDEIAKMGVVGRTLGNTGIFLKKNLTGGLGVINGLFAAMTVNSVINAKKGEKVSTFMEDVLGTWVGSIGGFRLFENILKGLCKFIDPKTNKVVEKGLIPTVAKIVNKVPFKGFIVPMAGAMIISTMMQKLSHKLFGKPTKEEPKVIDSVNSFNDWLTQTGWTMSDFENSLKAQAEMPPANNQN
ncbi:MAG: hypothetical protein AB1782_18390 [Cyanobacteriota bacterium]